MTLDKAIPLLGALLLCLLILVLIRKRSFRSFPVFFIYQIWCLSSTLSDRLAASLSQMDYVHYYVLNMSVDALFQFAVLAGLGRAVAQHNRNRSPRWFLIALLILPAALLLRSLSDWSLPADITKFGIFYVRMQQTLPILLLAFLLALVWWSRLQRFHWPDFALHIASGLGFYFLVCLLVAVIHTHQSQGVQYHWVDQAQSGSYLGVLAYWLLKLS
jgi:hypothetical protein